MRDNSKSSARHGRSPPIPLSLSFSKLKFETTKGKVILNDVTGYVPAGELCGVLGPSGSGKTCLLDCLAMRRKKGGSLKEGKVLYGGRQLSNASKGRFLCYIGQEDVLFPSFTVRETLRYAVRLDIGFSLSSSEVDELVDEIMSEVGLTSSADVRVGNPYFDKGISGGQRRRLMIAVELVSCPAVMILDEPTSGLDFASAFGVMKELQSLTKLGHTILTVIHQPSSQIWNLFDRVGFLTQGSFAYFGPTSDLLPYFEKLGHVCPEFYNHAEFVLDLLTPSSEITETTNDSLVDSFRASSILAVMNTKISEEGVLSNRPSKINLLEASVRSSADQPSVHTNTNQQHRASGFVTSLILLHRNMMDLIRNPAVLFNRAFLILLISILVGLSFYHVGHRYSDEAIRSRSSAIFFLPAFTSIVSVAVIPNIITNRNVIKKEVLNGRYGVHALAASFLMPILVSAMILALSSSVPAFFMIGFRNFAEFLLVMFLHFLIIEILVYASAMFVTHHLVGMLIVLGVALSGMALCGYFVVFHRITFVVRWIGYVTPNRYIFRAFMRNEFETMGNLTTVHYPTGRDYLDFFGFYDDDVYGYWLDVIVLFAFCAAFFITFLTTVSTLTRK